MRVPSSGESSLVEKCNCFPGQWPFQQASGLAGETPFAVTFFYVCRKRVGYGTRWQKLSEKFDLSVSGQTDQRSFPFFLFLSLYTNIHQCICTYMSSDFHVFVRGLCQYHTNILSLRLLSCSHAIIMLIRGNKTWKLCPLSLSLLLFDHPFLFLFSLTVFPSFSISFFLFHTFLFSPTVFVLLTSVPFPSHSLLRFHTSSRYHY